MRVATATFGVDISAPPGDRTRIKSEGIRITLAFSEAIRKADGAMFISSDVAAAVSPVEEMNVTDLANSGQVRINVCKEVIVIESSSILSKGL